MKIVKFFSDRIAGFVFVFLIIGSIYVMFFTNRSWFDKSIVILGWLMLLKVFSSKEARKRRIEKYGSSNIFKALFSDKK
jgi:hypothetical protein